jgi:hypothetical protein
MRDIIERVVGGRRLLVAVAGLLLAVASVAVASTASAGTRAAAPAVLAGASASDAGVQQVAPGSGTLFYDWGCDGSYSSTSITFNAAGDFTTPGYTGLWVRLGGTAAGNQVGMLTFHFGGTSETTYSSVTTSSVATGIQTTFAGLTGCHYITESGLSGAVQLNNDTYTVEGKPKR